MKAATTKELKEELLKYPHKELVDICLRLAKFKKENKELLSYLLYESGNEAGYVESIKTEMEEQFALLHRKTYYLMKKGVRKILRGVKTQIRYSQKKETEVELLIHFCSQMLTLRPSIGADLMLKNLYNRQLESTKKLVKKLHEDLQYDFELELENLPVK